MPRFNAVYRALDPNRYRFSVKNAAGSESAFFFLDQNLAFAGVIGLADDAFEFHPLHQRGCAVIADLQPALNVGSRGLAVAFDDRNRLREQVAGAAIAAAHAGGIEYRTVLVGRLFRGDR